MGTFETHFIVPDLSADSMLPQDSVHVIWSNQREPMKAAVGAAEKRPAQAAHADPLIVGDQKDRPQHHQGIPPQPELYVTFDVYDARPDPDNQRARRVDVSMSLFNQKGAESLRSRAAQGHASRQHPSRTPCPCSSRSR